MAEALALRQLPPDPANVILSAAAGENPNLKSKLQLNIATPPPQGPAHLRATIKMSFEQSSNLEAGHGDGRYRDDPGFQQLLGELRTKLRGLERNTLKLKTDVNLLGTKRDTARVRERSHTLLEKCREDCMTIGEGVKKLQAWDELSVRGICYCNHKSPRREGQRLTIPTEATEIRTK